MQTKRRSTYERIVWEEGLEQGRGEGRHTAAQELLMELLLERFGPCSEGLRTRIGAVRDEVRLRALARSILSVSSLPEFEARIGT